MKFTCLVDCIICDPIFLSIQVTNIIPSLPFSDHQDGDFFC